uniref:Uncharacterized protein n=1 Tax=Anopheles maculatus TaxID=74869 RepID=A0A182SHZ5_9DIPT
MENAQNKRRSTRGAAVPSQTFPSSSAIKNETPDAYGSRGQTRQPIMGSFQEASSSNSNDDPLAVEVDIGGTSITFHDPYFDMQTNYIKTEGIAADEIEDINDAVGSSKYHEQFDFTVEPK